MNIFGYNIHPQIHKSVSTSCKFSLDDRMIQVQAVVQEATYDAGKVPVYLRVDFLVDKQGLLGRLRVG